jgi:hypothetical protein
MKRFVSILIALFVLIPYLVFAAGSVTQQMLVVGPARDKARLIFTWVGDSSAGTVPTTETSAAITKELQSGWYAYLIVTNPGSPAPNDNYDIYLYDTDGVDIAGGMITNRDTSNTEQVLPKLDTVNSLYGSRIVTTALSIAVSGTTTGSATGSVTVYMYR